MQNLAPCSNAVRVEVPTLATRGYEGWVYVQILLRCPWQIWCCSCEGAFGILLLFEKSLAASCTESSVHKAPMACSRRTTHVAETGREAAAWHRQGR